MTMELIEKKNKPLKTKFQFTKKNGRNLTYLLSRYFQIQQKQ